MFPASAGGRGSPAVIAHRGGAAFGPDNSIEVLSAATRSGADVVEIDVRELADGTLVLAHDATLKRWWGLCRERLGAMDRDRYTRRTGAPPATVEDLLARLAGLHLGAYLDVKAVSSRSIPPLVDSIIGSCVATSTAIGSFDPSIVKAVVADGRLPASILYRDHGADPLALQEELGCVLVHPCFDNEPWMVRQMAGQWMDRVHAAGLRVVGWNSNDPALLSEMAAAGFDAICTDDPRLVQHAPWRKG